MTSAIIFTETHRAGASLTASEAGKLSVFKLASFAVIYGLLPINWIDLFNPAAPGYHVWLVIMYMAPFGIVVLLEGVSLLPLALSLGLLASLMNDLFYYPVGDLLFGMKVDVLSWWQGQLGFDGFKHIFALEGRPLFARCHVDDLGSLGAPPHVHRLIPALQMVQSAPRKRLSDPVISE